MVNRESLPLKTGWERRSPPSSLIKQKEVVEMEENSMVRIGSRVSREVHEWLEEKSKKSGVPKSTLIYMALEQQMQQEKTINGLTMVFQKLEEIESRLPQT